MNAQDVIRRLCHLQGEVQDHVGYENAADCFCGEGGFWNNARYDGTEAEGYRNEGKALEFIESAVRKELKRLRKRRRKSKGRKS